MITGRRVARLAVVALGVLTVVPVLLIGGRSTAGADTDPSTISGQGGSFLQPVVSQLIQEDTQNLSPLFGAYTSTDSAAGIAAFVGSAPGTFSADYAVTERPLTAAESATAKANGRGYAYVPIAATPVAIATLVPTEAWRSTASTTIDSSDFCAHTPLTVDQLGAIYGYDAASPLQLWNDPRITCPPGGPGAASGDAISLWANLDPSAANFALMSLLDSTATSQAEFAAGLSHIGAHSLTTDTTPSELWPYGLNTIPGGDQPLIGKLLAIGSQNNAPSKDPTMWQLGATAPMSSVWTTAPLGVPWNLATAAIQNAQGSFVAPSTAAAQAALVDSTMASTSDPTTNGLVTFNAASTDASAYNNYLMEESYLVVPTTGLTAAKATGLAQLIRFSVGAQGRQIISTFGAAPDTAAMTAEGQAVATTLNAEAATENAAFKSSGSTTTTTTTAGGAATTTGSTTAATSAATSGSSGSSTGTTDGTSTGGLAFTGAPDVGVLVAAAGSLIAFGTLLRRRLRYQKEDS